jgi:YVTN family beta-propeller protein
VGNQLQGAAVTPDGTRVYVANRFGAVSVIDTATNTIVATITLATQTVGIAVTPDGARVYVADELAGEVTVIETATNTVLATISVGFRPFAFGIFIALPVSAAATTAVATPTLSEWGMLLLVLALLGGGAWRLARRAGA